MQRNTSSKEGLFSNIDSSLETENVEMLTKSPLNSNTTHVNLNQVTNTNHKLTATDSASQNITNHSHLYISPTSNFASPSHVLQTHPIEYSSPTLPEAIENHNQIGLNCVEHASESIQSPTPVESKVLKLASPSRDPGSDSFQLPHIESFSTRVAPTKVITQEPNSLCSSSLNTWPVPQSSTSIGSRFQSCMNSSKSPLNSHINYGKRDVDMSTSNLESQKYLICTTNL
ncbi:hypothetical protein BC833DRAFT_271659 [Globomyces pollinis-pini]|nr:hypothetical protein BC833DRAFT_271659 [Globomyces pollinis-pini]